MQKLHAYAIYALYSLVLAKEGNEETTSMSDGARDEGHTGDIAGNEVHIDDRAGDIDEVLTGDRAGDDSDEGKVEEEDEKGKVKDLEEDQENFWEVITDSDEPVDAENYFYKEEWGPGPSTRPEDMP